jgi:hypothetical protein
MNNYPPGMRESDIPGIDDIDVSYSAVWLEEGDFDVDEGIFNLPSMMKEYLGVPVKIDWSSFEYLLGAFSVFVEYQGDICIDPHDDYDDAQRIALDDLNQYIPGKLFSLNEDELEITILS